MKIICQNVRGIERVEFSPPRICLIGGENGAGKSSLLGAIAAALTGEAITWSGLTKKAASRLVRAGSAGGTVTVEIPTGAATVTYPEAKYSSVGDPPRIGRISAGLDSIAELNKKDRAIALGELYGIEPTEAELRAELDKISGIKKRLTVEEREKLYSRTWSTIAAQGWDAGLAVSQEKGANLKGRWEQLTGDKYGIRKSAGWTPGAWSNDLAEETEDRLSAAVESEREWIESAIAHKAISDSDRSRLAKLAEKLPGLQESKRKSTADRLDLTNQKQERLTRLSGIPSPKAPKVQHCPKCKTDLVVEDGKIKAPKTLSDAERKKIEAEIENLQSEAKAIQDSIDGLFRFEGKLDAEISEAENASRELQAAGEAGVQETDAKALEDARARLQAAEERLSAWRVKREADQIRDDISLNKKIGEILAPGGLRQTVLERALGELNGRLQALTGAASWPLVRIENDMSVTYNGTPYYLASESEQFRTRFCLQVVQAIQESAGLILVDRADILDRPGRNGLLRILSSINLGAVVCMTLLDRSQLPDLTAIGGASYWLERGGFNA